MLLGLVLSLLVVGVALAAGNISATDKWAWSTNAGWVNFNPDNGGVTVYPDHLEGYAWGENIGWIRMGTHTAGGSHTYTNADQNTYGVNRNTATGALSGYAWSTTYFYWVEDVDIYGTATRHGPVSVDFSVPTAVEMVELVAGGGRTGLAAWQVLLAALLATLGGLAWRRRRQQAVH